MPRLQEPLLHGQVRYGLHADGPLPVLALYDVVILRVPGADCHQHIHLEFDALDIEPLLGLDAGISIMQRGVLLQDQAFDLEDCMFQRVPLIL